MMKSGKRLALTAWLALFASVYTAPALIGEGAAR